ncbi:MAG: protein translocase subunit SecD, partial [Chloroflexota bacterium]|nr:protein translocase subunit SecD [Chloroflexota bacterium]
FTDLPRVLAEAGYEEFNIEFNDAMNFTVQSNTVNIETQGRALTEIGTQIGQLNRFEVTSGIDDAKALIGQTARLEFKERTCENEACTTFTDADLGLTGDDLSRAEAATNHLGVWVVNVQFNDRGSDIFSDLTRRISTTEAQATKRIAVLMDDRELIAPRALAWIRDGRTQISGNFNRDRARELAIQIEAGSLDVPLRLIQESDVDALLGSESLKNSLIAALVGLGLVFVFMIIYYRMAGVVAAFALVFYAIIVLAIFKMIPITLELAHIGGFILSIGMAVDANILIFERMKEEVRIGRTLASSMEVGFSRAWPAIRDSNISTMITCVVLLWFGDRLGGGLVTGVAISLFIGVAVSMFTAVVVSRNLLQLTAWIGLGGRIELFTPEPLNRTSRESIQTPAPRGGR